MRARMFHNYKPKINKGISTTQGFVVVSKDLPTENQSGSAGLHCETMRFSHTVAVDERSEPIDGY